MANIEKMAEATAAEAAEIESFPGSSKSSTSPLIANKFYNATHIPNKSIKERTPNYLSLMKSSLISDPQQTVPDTSNILYDNAENISPKSNLSHISNINMTPIVVPTMSLPLWTCSQHPEGKINGVEYPTCDMMLGSSRPLGDHVTMNSMTTCKTTMCPKCNWHYKYQETLEIHLKEKHPEMCVYCVTNQSHPRMASGKTYTCGYRPYRCEICNFSTMTNKNFSAHLQTNKHINNVQKFQISGSTSEHVATLQHQSQQQDKQHLQAAESFPVSVGIVAATEAHKNSQATLKPKLNWRREIYNYEKNVACKLRRRMTSEEQTHNLVTQQHMKTQHDPPPQHGHNLVIQPNIKHINSLSFMQNAQMDSVFQFHPGLLMPADAQFQPAMTIADMTYNHALLMASQQQQLMAAAAAANAENQHLSSPLNLSCPPAVGLEQLDPILIQDISYENKDKIYQCCVCSIYSSDSLDAVSKHVQLDRSRMREVEVLMFIEGTFTCKICAYKTNRKDNLKLHCSTDKHLQRLQHVNHVKEGGSKNEWKLKYVNFSDFVHIRCNACKYYTNYLHKMQLHKKNPGHEANVRLFLFLERRESVINSEYKSYHCTMCNVSVRTKVNLIQHANSLEHFKTENQRRKQGESKLDAQDIFIVKEAKQATTAAFKNENKDMNNGKIELGSHLPNNEQTKLDNKQTQISNTFTLQQAVIERSWSTSKNGNSDALQTCPFCYFSSNSEVRIQIHVLSEHSQKPFSAIACPLCQDEFREWGGLENHFMDSHQVNKESVERLLLAMVTKNEWMTEVKSNSRDTEDQIKDKARKEVEQNVVTNVSSSATDPRTFNMGGMIDEPMDVKQVDVDSQNDSRDVNDDNEFTSAALGT